METIHMPREFMLEVGDAAVGEFHSDDGRIELSRQLAIALHNREDGPWTGLPENVWIDTMSAFSRFVNEYKRSTGRWGFDRGFWTTRQINAKLFRLGELEYELLGGDGSPFEIALHIPSDVHLKPDLLNASLKTACQFLSDYFPDWASAPMSCKSWLLSPLLTRILPEHSNIRQFQEAFEIITVYPEDNSYLQWVFALTENQAKHVNPLDLPDDNTLRKGVKEMLLSGQKLGSAKGILAGEFS